MQIRFRHYLQRVNKPLAVLLAATIMLGDCRV
jgi:hypothetical protein